MGLFDIFKKKKATLNNDIEKSYKWISQALESSGYTADFTIDSLRNIDRFFEEHTNDGQPLPNGLLADRVGSKLFAIGSYVGETIRRAYGGEWETDDSDPEGEINIAVKLKNGTILFPVQRVMKRFNSGSGDSIYGYGISFEVDGIH